MTRVKLLKLMAGPDGVTHTGQTVTVDDEQARALIECGAAVLVDTPKPAVVIEETAEVETADIEPATEFAAIRKGRRR